MSTHARNTDPGTSHEAARSVTDLNEKQAAVHACIKTLGPLSDRGLIQTYEAMRHGRHWPRQSDSGLRTRRSELADIGLVTDVGTVVLESGRKALLWGIPGPRLDRMYPGARKALGRRRRAA